MERLGTCCRDLYTYPVTRQKALIIGGIIATVLLLIVIIIVISSGDDDQPPVPVTGKDSLKKAPLIVGQNDLAKNLKKILKNRIKDYNFLNSTADSTTIPSCLACATDFTTLEKGRVAIQVFSVSIGCLAQAKDAVTLTLEQVDVIQRLIAKYPGRLFVTTDSADVEKLFVSKKMGALIAIKGGHTIDSRMAVLRMFYDAGVRIMSLAGDCDTPWSTFYDTTRATTTTPPAQVGLSEFGKAVVQEMNRLGMVVDLSSSSKQTQIDALSVSKAPVIFSGSNAADKCTSTQNVASEVLDKLKANNGLIMVSFDPTLIKAKVGDAEVTAGIADLITHLNFLKDKVGADCIGIGGNFDGYQKKMTDLKDASAIPALFDELYKAKWKMEELEKLAGKNFLRVLKAVEDKAQEKEVRSLLPNEQYIPKDSIDATKTCYSDFDARYS